MEAAKKKALEAAGWQFGDAADFLGMTEDERQLLDARVEAALAVRRQRTMRNLSQKELANRIKSSQPRVAKIERAAKDVSLDQILRAFVAAGGKVVVRQIGKTRSNRSANGPKRAQRKRKTTVNSAESEVQIDLIGMEV